MSEHFFDVVMIDFDDVDFCCLLSLMIFQSILLLLLPRTEYCFATVDDFVVADLC